MALLEVDGGVAQGGRVLVGRASKMLSGSDSPEDRGRDLVIDLKLWC